MHSVRKAEVQPFVSFVLSRLQIRRFLLLCHGIPNHLSVPVHFHIIDLRPNEQQEIIRANCNQYLVSPAVQRLVIIAVNILRNDR